MGSIYGRTAISKPAIRRVAQRAPVKPTTESERAIHHQITQLLDLKFPQALYRTDGAGYNLSKVQRGQYKMLNKSRGWPDIFIANAQRGYHGLFIEVKRKNATVYLKNGPRKGKLSTNPHIQEQAKVMQDLYKAGYYAAFACGYEEAEKIIHWYFGVENTELDLEF